MAVDVRKLRAGMDIISADGEKIGDVVDVHDSSVVHAGGGFLFERDLYIPPEAITRTEGGRVYLNVTKDQVTNLGWDQPRAPYLH